MGSSEDGSHHTDGSDIDEKKGKKKSDLSLFSSASIVYRCSIPQYLNDRLEILKATRFVISKC